ncbi:MAG: putative sulfate/molybdate transporter [Gammaproteobacteria bacterium]|nr:putative sulfate/molybdate transporter [Gammaproteobacteria bacterium]
MRGKLQQREHQHGDTSRQSSPSREPVSPQGDGGGARSDVLGDLSGAFADLGTFLPIIIGVFAVQQVDPAGLLFGFGVFALATAAVYRRPVPVQPMKAVAAVAIAGGLGTLGLTASGILLGVLLIALAGFGVVGRLGKLIPSTVMNGIQLGVAFYLAWAGLKLMAREPWLAAAALLILLVLQFTRLKPLAALTVIGVSALWGMMHDPQILPPIIVGLSLPTFQLPGTGDLLAASGAVLLPQLALTLTNATVITAAIAADYFPADRARITPDRLAMSTGVLNLLLAPFGAFPMCHGAGGLVVQHRFGARTGLAPAIFGVTCLSLGLLLGEHALDLLAVLPLAAVGAMLLVAGFDLANSKRLRTAPLDELAVIVATAVACVVVNVAIGLVAGVLFEWLRRMLKVRGQAT